MALAFPNNRVVNLNFNNANGDNVKAELLNGGTLVNGVTLTVQNGNEVAINTADQPVPISSDLTVRIVDQSNANNVSVSERFEFFQSTQPVPPTVPTQNNYLIHFAAAGEIYQDQTTMQNNKLPWLFTSDESLGTAQYFRNHSGYEIGQDVLSDNRYFLDSSLPWNLMRDDEDLLYVNTAVDAGTNTVNYSTTSLNTVPNSESGFHYFFSFIVPNSSNAVGTEDVVLQDNGASAHTITLRRTYADDGEGGIRLSAASILLGTTELSLLYSLDDSNKVILEIIIPEIGDCIVRVHSADQIDEVAADVTDSREVTDNVSVYQNTSWYAYSAVKNTLAGERAVNRDELLSWHAALIGSLGSSNPLIGSVLGGGL